MPTCAQTCEQESLPDCACPFHFAVYSGYINSETNLRLSDRCPSPLLLEGADAMPLSHAISTIAFVCLICASPVKCADRAPEGVRSAGFPHRCVSMRTAGESSIKGTRR
ncbi:hypothetical protein B7486_17075 [cyanobacterium TDX16]|nr:hypothetical protein B7486_17075 [cyanobacterium TDX16]